MTQSTHTLSEPGAATISDEPFGVMFGGPQGKCACDSEVTIVFNRPLRLLDLAGSEMPVPATISPDVAGSWQWVGTNTIRGQRQTSRSRSTDHRKCGIDFLFEA